MNILKIEKWSQVLCTPHTTQNIIAFKNWIFDMNFSIFVILWYEYIFLLHLMMITKYHCVRIGNLGNCCFQIGKCWNQYIKPRTLIVNIVFVCTKCIVAQCCIVRISDLMCSCQKITEYVV